MHLIEIAMKMFSMPDFFQNGEPFKKSFYRVYQSINETSETTTRLIRTHRV